MQRVGAPFGGEWRIGDDGVEFTAAAVGNVFDASTNALLLDSLVSVSDFAAANDYIDISGITGIGTRIAQNVVNAAVAAASPADLLEAADAAFGTSTAAGSILVFAFGGNTYVGVDLAGGPGLQADDVLIELTGVKVADLTAANFIV